MYHPCNVIYLNLPRIYLFLQKFKSAFYHYWHPSVTSQHVSTSTVCLCRFLITASNAFFIHSSINQSINQ